MASSGKVCPAHIIGTIVTILLAVTGTAFASDGPGVRDDLGVVATETHEVLPTGALGAPPALKTTTTGTLLTEGFEGAFPGGWQLYHDSAGADVSWGKTSHRKSAGSYSIWCAAQGSDSPGTGGNVPIHTNT